jgi:hypothetical protein
MSDGKTDARMELTQATMNVLDNWKLDSGEMRAVLDMPGNVRARAFHRFREDTPFPDEDQVLRRVNYVLRIADALRTTFPRNPEMGARWIRQRNRRFGRSPLSLMLEGESGMISVLSELDCTFAWDLTGSKSSGAPSGG